MEGEDAREFSDAPNHLRASGQFLNENPLRKAIGQSCLDSLDIGVLRELLVDESTLSLQTDVRRPYRDLARNLHVDEDTIRNRVRKMEDGELIRGWRLGLNPTLFGYQAEFVWIDVNPPSTKEEVLRALKSIPNVIGVQNYFDEVIGVSLAYANRELLDKEIVRLRRAANSHGTLTAKTPFLPCRMKLKEKDWGIVKSLRRDPRKSYGEVAKELGVSRRTVRRRAEKMIRERVLWALPELDLKKLQGGVLASLSVYYPPEHKSKIDRQIHEKYGEFLLYAQSTLPERGWFLFIVPNLAVAKEIQAFAGSLPHVGSAFVKAIYEFINLLGQAFEQELKEAPMVVSRGQMTS